jgi:hypothetical protein
MDFKSTYTLASAAFPGVEVTLRRLGPKRRAEIELAIAGPRARFRELAVRHDAIRAKLIAALDACPKDAAGAPVEAELSDDANALGVARLAVWSELTAVKRALIDPAFVAAAVKGFAGEPLTYNGAPATADLVLEYGPSSLLDEIISSIEDHASLTPEAEQNLLSPSIFPQPGNGEAQLSTAMSAKTNGST